MIHDPAVTTGSHLPGATGAKRLKQFRAAANQTSGHPHHIAKNHEKDIKNEEINRFKEKYIQNSPKYYTKAPSSAQKERHFLMGLHVGDSVVLKSGILDPDFGIDNGDDA